MGLLVSPPLDSNELRLIVADCLETVNMPGEHAFQRIGFGDELSNLLQS